MRPCMHIVVLCLMVASSFLAPWAQGRMPNGMPPAALNGMPDAMPNGLPGDMPNGMPIGTGDDEGYKSSLLLGDAKTVRTLVTRPLSARILNTKSLVNQALFHPNATVRQREQVVMSLIIAAAAPPGLLYHVCSAVNPGDCVDYVGSLGVAPRWTTKGVGLPDAEARQTSAVLMLSNNPRGRHNYYGAYGRSSPALASNLATVPTFPFHFDSDAPVMAMWSNATGYGLNQNAGWAPGPVFQCTSGNLVRVAIGCQHGTAVIGANAGHLDTMLAVFVSNGHGTNAQEVLGPLVVLGTFVNDDAPIGVCSSSPHSSSVDVLCPANGMLTTGLRLHSPAAWDHNALAIGAFDMTAGVALPMGIERTILSMREMAAYVDPKEVGILPDAITAATNPLAGRNKALQAYQPRYIAGSQDVQFCDPRNSDTCECPVDPATQKDCSALPRADATIFRGMVSCRAPQLTAAYADARFCSDIHGNRECIGQRAGYCTGPAGETRNLSSNYLCQVDNNSGLFDFAACYSAMSGMVVTNVVTSFLHDVQSVLGLDVCDSSTNPCALDNTAPPLGHR